ncbi:hypothetical protein HETIRDRAFT_173894 [Heterobasidion irregulare TC 32-1]|uniref:WW domain-containing protein n=1 Tax=Heterobasidion irregulare (strain TC 32-1) TaxID=747525 RepID=W4JX56_HETIT|nr:uncharacterized protein HETIRDRAFT_173894 [Heterobasidion irregulare TC 32-1]ETW77461.1 hypothetical protein HETIRDRAFT_173894 [Heterobasidion irregulare TC 32-1]
MTLNPSVIIRLFLDLTLGQTRKACRLAARRLLYMCLSCRLHMSTLLSYLSRALQVGARSPRGASPPRPNRDHDLIPSHSEAVISSLAHRIPAPQTSAEEIAHGAYDSRSSRSSAEDVIVPSLCPPPAVHIDHDRPGLPTTANIIHRTPSRYRTLDIILDNREEIEREDGDRSCATPDSRPLEYIGNGSLTPCSGNKTVASPFVESDKAEKALEISVKAIHPGNVRRWDRDVYIAAYSAKNAPKKNECTVLSPFSRFFHPTENKTEWISYVNPDGSRYFFNEDKRVYTDADPGEPDSQKYQGIICAIQEIDRIAGSSDVSFRNHDLVLELLDEEDGKQDWGYYFADHQHGIIFWPKSFDIEDAVIELGFNPPDAVLKHELQTWYWSHCSLFPRAAKFTRANVEEVCIELRNGILGSFPLSSPIPLKLMQLRLDQMLSSASLAPYSIDNSKTMLETLTYWRDVSTFDDGMVIYVTHARFLNCHGEIGARLDPSRSLYGPRREKHTWPFRVLSLLLFKRTEDCFRTLSSVTMDNILAQSTWTPFIANERTHWDDVNRQCMQLLAGNIAFLAVPSVIEAINNNNSNSLISNFAVQSASNITGNSFFPQWTPAQILSALSTFSVITSVAYGFLLRELYRPGFRTDLGQLVSIAYVKPIPLN